MSSSKELFKLIQSLSKTEKAYFKKQSSFGTGKTDKGYLKLFDVIANMNEYDEAMVVKKIKNSAFAGYLPTAKNQLFHSILKALRGYYVSGSIDLQLQEILQEVELLHNKALMESGLRIIAKGKKLALERERFVFYLQFLDWEQRIISSINAITNTHKYLYEKSLKENYRAIRLCTNLLENREMSHEVVSNVLRTNSFHTDEKQQIVKAVLARNHVNELSARAKIILLMTQKYIYDRLNEPQKGYETLTALNKIYEDHAFLQKDQQQRYFNSLYQTALKALEIHEFSIAADLIQKAENVVAGLSNDMVYLKTRFKSHVNNLVLSNYIVSGSVPEKSIEINKIETGMPLLKKNFNELWIHTINLISYSQFTSGDYKKARKNYYDLINETESKLSETNLFKLKLLLIIAHYELNDTDLMEHSIKSFLKSLSKKEGDFSFELQLLGFLKGLIGRESKSEKTDHFKKFGQSALICGLNIKPMEFNYPVWIESKIKHVTMNEVFKENKNRLSK